MHACQRLLDGGHNLARSRKLLLERVGLVVELDGKDVDLLVGEDRVAWQLLQARQLLGGGKRGEQACK
jgi:hypothetical protein